MIFALFCSYLCYLYLCCVVVMAEGLTDDEIQQLVDNYKLKRIERPEAAAQKLREGRVHVNRSVSMDRIKYVGFDMDYTLVEYKSPEYEKLAFDLAVERLVSIGYPQEVSKIDYDPTFPLRGLFFDKTYGNLLKSDQFGNILSCFHGFRSLTSVEIRRLYPNKYVQPLDSRLFILYTLYNLPEVFMLAALVDFFDNHPEYTGAEEIPGQAYGVKCGDVVISYKMIWQDIRASIDWVHNQGDVKKRTLENLKKYVPRNPQLPVFLDKLRRSGRKTFIVTNSGYAYTQRLMKYMLEEGPTEQGKSSNRSWKSYFDYIIVDAKKPLFFEEGSMLREVDEATGSLRLGVFTGALQPGKVYNGGSSDAFCKYTGAHGKEILYVGDHIFGDVIKAKREQAWRTFLVVPELDDEVGVWESCKGLFMRLQNLEFVLAEMYTNGTSTQLSPAGQVPNIDSLRKAIKVTAQEMENSYPSQLGSLLRCGSRQTHFAVQASRFADLYGSSCINLINYPDCYLFSAPHQLMPHETQPVPVDELFRVASPLSSLLASKISAKKNAKRSTKKSEFARGLSIVDIDLDEEDGPRQRVRAAN